MFYTLVSTLISFFFQETLLNSFGKTSWSYDNSGYFPSINLEHVCDCCKSLATPPNHYACVGLSRSKHVFVLRADAEMASKKADKKSKDSKKLRSGPLSPPSAGPGGGMPEEAKGKLLELFGQIEHQFEVLHNENAACECRGGYRCMNTDSQGLWGGITEKIM